MSLMDSTCIAIIVILVILVGLSARCSSTETAYSSVNKVRLKNKAEDGNPRAQNALDLLEKYDKVLSCILIGNNIVNLTGSPHWEPFSLRSCWVRSMVRRPLLLC